MPKIGATFRARDRRTWRAWLAKHHRTRKEIWLVLFKRHTRERCVSYEAAVEEALCFGWIDGILKRIDDEKHVVRFGPRRPKSVWAESNKKRVRKLIREGKMTEAGMALVRAAKKSGEWQKPAGRGLGTVVPADLRRALAGHARARAGFDAFPPSHRRMYVAWVLDAKREETRRRRVREVVLRAARRKRPGID